MMSSPDERVAAGRKRGLPVGLTIATVISLVILFTLGGWQMKRLAWKTDLLARIEANRTAPPVSFTDIERLKAAGELVEWRRVALTCAPPLGGDRQVLIYGVTDGAIAWRAVSPCQPTDKPTVTVGLERGVVKALVGQTEPGAVTLPPPGEVVGIVRLFEDAGMATTPQHVDTSDGRQVRWRRDAEAFSLLATPEAPASDFYIAVEAEQPAVEGLTPTPTPPDIPNRHLEYALTWFGLAGALIAIYGAMLWRRFKTP
jgi:surfeit locus 1 family protein